MNRLQSVLRRQWFLVALCILIPGGLTTGIRLDADRVDALLNRINPRIVNVEFLSDVRSGVGTRFRETREMDGKKATTELEVTEYVDNERVRIVSDTHGTVWDTVFSVREIDGKTELEMVMDANAYKLLPKLVNPLIKGAIRKAIEADLDGVKAHCEKRLEQT